MFSLLPSALFFLFQRNILYNKHHRHQLLSFLPISFPVCNCIWVVGQQMTIPTNPLLIRSRTSLLIEEIKANFGPLRRKRIHLVHFALSQLVFLDLFLRAQPILKPICDRIWMVPIQMTEPTRPAVSLSLTATLKPCRFSYNPLFE